MRPGDQLLEIGCGRGSAAFLVCSRLTRGHLLAIDRSATAIKAAEERNRDHIAAGKVTFQHTPLAGAALDGWRFHKVFAINVNIFWVLSSAAEIAMIRSVLRPRGQLFLFYEAPDSTRTQAIGERVSTVLSGHGWQVTTTSTLTRRHTAVVGLRCIR